MPWEGACPYGQTRQKAQIKTPGRQPVGRGNRLLLRLGGSTDGASTGAGAALDALISVDDVLVFAFRDSANGAFGLASAALDAFIRNYIRHGLYLQVLFGPFGHSYHTMNAPGLQVFFGSKDVLTLFFLCRDPDQKRFGFVKQGAQGPGPVLSGKNFGRLCRLCFYGRLSSPRLLRLSCPMTVLAQPLVTPARMTRLSFSVP